MAATIKSDDVRAERYGEDTRILAITGDTSYPTGGYTVGGTTPKNSDVVGINDLATNIAEYVVATDKVKFIVRSTGAEVAGAADVSASTVRLLIPA